MLSAKVGVMLDSEVDADNSHLIPPQSGEANAHFANGNKAIDFVLPYKVEKDDDDYAEIASKRDRYLDSLVNEFHLQMEVVAEGDSTSVYGTIQKDQEKDEKIYYIKVHAPIDTLYDAAEDLQMKMPTKESDINIKEWYEDTIFTKCLGGIFNVRRPETRESQEYFVQTFDRDRLSQFINHDKPEIFFSPPERARLVFNLLQQARYGDDDEDIGIENLIHDGVFLDAYPLHDGPALKTIEDKCENDRQRLQKDWASIRCLFRYQPIDAIREYFGEKIALYFSWLGVYTMFLIPASIVGIICFIYGIVSSFSSESVKESCSDPRGGPNTFLNGSNASVLTHMFYMCPLCDKRCSYFLLNTNCLYAKVTHFFDNGATIFFAVFISVWSTLFLEFWKRQQTRLAQKWHSLGFEDAEERVRPEYLAANKTLKTNPVTMKKEPYMPTKARCQRLLGAVSVVGFFILLILACVIGVILFRAAVSAALQATKNKIVQERSSIIVSILAALINLLVINILKFVYNKIAVILTDWENPRTRTDYEDSFTIKMFMFQFVNTYSSIFYIAFFKTELITGSPGKYKRFTSSRFRMSGCSAQGCFLQLTIQLIIIMVGQQVISNVIEVLLPTVMKWWKDRKARQALSGSNTALNAVQPQWEDDFEGEMQTKFSLFWEYLEIVLQYGFVTMFVAAFPLAPLFALLNNFAEIRIDAYNYVKNCRRPVAKRAEDIGAWYNILSALTSISVLINAFVLAFTSTFIDNTVFKYTDSKDGTLKGYVDWSLSTFDVTQFEPESTPDDPLAAGIPQQQFCRYPGMHQDDKPWDRNLTYWKVLSVRLAFVLCFVMFVLFITFVVQYLVPDVPESVTLRIKREKFLTAQADRDHKEKTGKRAPRKKKEEDAETTTSAL